MRRLVCIMLVCIMGISLFAGCSSSDKFMDDETSPVSSLILSEADAQLLSDKEPLRLYFANEDYSKLKLEIRYIPKSEAEKSVNHKAEIIVNELISGPKVQGLNKTIPDGTKLKSKIKVDGGVATVDMSKEFKEKHSGGKAEEKMTIFSIVNSLTELKEISKVKFLINGKTTAEYKGGYKFDKAFPRSTALISTKAEPAGGASIPQNSPQNREDSTSDKKDMKENPNTNGKAEDASAGVEDVEQFEETFEGEVEETYIDLVE